MFLIILRKEEFEIDNIEEKLKECKNKYGRLDVTDKELLEKYSNELSDFKDI